MQRSRDYGPLSAIVVPAQPTTGVTLVQLLVPSNPALAGATIDFQGIALTQVFPLLAGAWTNRIGVAIQP